MPVHARLALLVLAGIAACCIFYCGMPPLLRGVCLVAVVFELLVGGMWIQKFKTFRLACDAEGGYWLSDAQGVWPLFYVNWQDYGFLLVFDYRIDSRRHRAFWWPYGLPLAQRRQLRLWMNASKNTGATEMPSLYVNPVS